MRIGLALGADVPFFVFGAPAIARGIGERLTAVSLPPMWVCVLAPPIAVPDRVDFRRAGIDTRDALSENGRLFRGLWPE